MGTLGVIERDGEQYTVVASRRVTGCGHKFDGRLKFMLRRVSDGKTFTWLGSRHSKKVPFNARLLERRGADEFGPVVEIQYKKEK